MKWVDAALAWAALLYSSVESFTRSMTLVVALVFAVLFLRYVQSKRSKRFLDGQPPLIITSKGPRQLRAKLMPTVNGVLGLPEEDYMEPGNKDSPRASSHGLDSLLGGQNRSKRIQDWMGFFGSSGLWLPSNNQGRAVAIAHAGLGYSTQLAYDSGPQQLYVSTVPSSAPQGGMLKAAVAHRPELWVSTAVVNAVDGVSPVVNGNVVTHASLMPEGGTKVVQVGPEKYTEKYSYAGMPTEYPRVGYAVPDGCTIELSANGRGLRFLTHETGEAVQYMHTQDAYGWWGTAEVSTLINNTGGVELVPRGTQLILGRTYHIFDLVPVAAEWSESFGQVHIDPNVTISGPTDTDDTWIWDKFVNSNFGGNVTISTGYPGTTAFERRGITRLHQSALPGGTTTAYTFIGHRIGDANQTVGGTVDFYSVLKAWTEGTATASGTNAHATWNNYTTGVPWASAGLGSGTDYRATSGNSYAFTALPSGTQDENISLPPEWVDNWYSGAWGADGFHMKVTSAPVVNSFFPLFSSEWGVVADRVEHLIEYSVGNHHYRGTSFAGNNFSNIASEGFQMGEPFSKTLERAQRFFVPRLRAA